MLNGSGDVGPNEFGLEDMVPKDVYLEPEKNIDLDDILRMRPNYFEGLVAVLWQKKGFRTVYRTPDSGDEGVDVVAIASNGELIQCKSSTVDDKTLG
jgi:HJR/Mrr/RecB family endonuclease